MRSNSRFLLPLGGLVIIAGLACNSSTDNTNGGGGGGGGTPANVVIVVDAQFKGYHAFSPDTFTVTLASGGKVKWSNHDLSMTYGDPGVTHHLAADGGEFTSPNIGPGASYTNTFATEGTFVYHCTVHPGMRGAIIVTP